MESLHSAPRDRPVITPAMIEAGGLVVADWFPFDGERAAISKIEAEMLARAILEAVLVPA